MLNTHTVNFPPTRKSQEAYVFQGWLMATRIREQYHIQMQYGILIRDSIVIARRCTARTLHSADDETYL